jgi:hypothetical protein
VLYYVIFGNLAVIACEGGRPMALRPRLSPGLPLSDVVLRSYYNTKRPQATLQGIIKKRPFMEFRLNLAGTFFRGGCNPLGTRTLKSKIRQSGLITCCLHTSRTNTIGYTLGFRSANS